jgi:Dolichyl-phosphate-mannose-protein mannosyltransferase
MSDVGNGKTHVGDSLLLLAPTQEKRLLASDEKSTSTRLFGRLRWLAVLLPILLYSGMRLPALLHQPGGQDEQFFAVPGWTVLQEGVPRIPYLPTRNRPSFFENADRCLMAIPPALFYVQAPFFALFPPGYPTARLPSFFGALLILFTSYRMSQLLGANVVTALLGSILLALSRPLLFTGIIARPDLLCILCGLLAIMVLLSNEDWNRWQVIGLTGGLCGFS